MECSQRKCGGSITHRSQDHFTLIALDGQRGEYGCIMMGWHYSYHSLCFHFILSMVEVWGGAAVLLLLRFCLHVAGARGGTSMVEEYFSLILDAKQHLIDGKSSKFVAT